MTGEQHMWGLWHRGWCSFQTTRSPSRLGFGYSGSREEAERGREVFLSEGGSPAEYTVMLFDPALEPPAVVGWATNAQRELLAYVQETGTINRIPLPKNWRRTTTVLFQKGWVTANLNDEGQELSRRPLRITLAGLRAMYRSRISGRVSS